MGLDYSLLWGTVLCIVGYFEAPLACTHSKVVALSPPSSDNFMSPDNAKCPQRNKMTSGWEPCYNVCQKVTCRRKKDRIRGRVGDQRIGGFAGFKESGQVDLIEKVTFKQIWRKQGCEPSRYMEELCRRRESASVAAIKWEFAGT